MKNTSYYKLINAISKSFYGIDVTIGQGLLALFMVLALLLISAYNASAVASLLIVLFRQKPDGMLFYFFTLVLLGVLFGSLWNLISAIRKNITYTKFIRSNIGTVIISYFLLIFSSYSIVFKINYSKQTHNVEDLFIFLNNKTKNDIYLAVFIAILQVLLIAYILIQKKLLIDSFFNKSKISQFDSVYAYLFKDLYNLNNSNSNSRSGILDIKNSNYINENIFLDSKSTIPEIDLMKTFLLREEAIEKRREMEEAKTKIKYLEQQVSAQVTIIKAIEHELANSLLPASRGFKHIIGFLEEKYSEILNDRILPSNPQSLSIGALKKIVVKNLEYSYEILNSISEVVICDPNQMDKRLINFQNFIKSEFSSFDFDKTLVQLKFSGNDNFDILIDDKQFRIFLKNLFKNAKMHGFHNKPDGTILFNIEKSENDLTIEMFNNGNPFSAGFSSDYFFKPLKKFGETGNKGIGGFLMNLVVQNHGGILSLSDCSNTHPDFNVCFIIKLPIKNIADESIN
jgi:hypothetical protein